jgi:alpha-NAC-related protein
MFPTLDPKKMEKMLKKLGIETEPIYATEVLIKTPSGEIRITNPRVIKTTMKGQVIFQISGSVEEAVSEEDIKLVMEQSGCRDRSLVEKTLKETQGDVVEAIMRLKK